MSSISLWTEEYRPKNFNEYVWRDKNMRAKAEEWVAEGVLPNLILSGKSGCGKTSLALMLMKMLNIPEEDILFIPASKDRGANDIQDKIQNFIGTWAMGESGIKYIILDEFDAVSPMAQKSLRTDIETYSNTTRFILTCNYENKIIEPLLEGRFHIIRFQSLEMDEFLDRIVSILDEEHVEWDFDALESYVKVSYPNLRKCISLVQHRTVGGKLTHPGSEETSIDDYLLKAIDLFKKGKFTEGRKIIVSNAQIEDYPEIYRVLYRNLDLFGSTQDQQDDALIIIKNGVVQHSSVFDPEINLSACLCELVRKK